MTNGVRQGAVSSPLLFSVYINDLILQLRQSGLGSNLWDLFSDDVDKLYRSWNVTIRNVFKLPYTTHRYLIETVSRSLHPKTMLTSRYVKFTESLTLSSKVDVSYLAKVTINDNRILMGRTLSHIAREIDTPKCELTPSVVKNKMVYFPVPDHEKWRCDIILEMLSIRKKSLVLENFNEDENTTILNYLCTS